MHIKHIVAFLAVLFAATVVESQTITGKISTTMSKQIHDPSYSMGRDYWFALIQNGFDQPGKYYRVYITSQHNTTAYVQLSSGIVTTVPVGAYKIGAVNVPLGWEMKSSSIIEQKAIHVWSNDADLQCCVMSHSPYTSDGFNCIPTIGWGTDYVVAGYNALYYNYLNYTYDYPSEFTIVADQDNTTITITPSCDLRHSSVYPANNTIVGYPKGVPFTIKLDRRQSVQFQSLKADTTFGFDVTGTIIHSNMPVGVVAGSSCAEIPDGYSYCDHVCEMIHPVRSWGQTYYTTSFGQPSSAPSHDFAMYLLVSSKANQTIYRQDAVMGVHTECTIARKYGTFWAEEQLSNKWFSDAPFLLMEYSNSATYPDDSTAKGDPSEVRITPRENFTRTVVLQTPVNVGSQPAYDNYANVIVRTNDERNTIFDGARIQMYTRQPIDDTFEAFVVPHIQPGAHVITGDTLGVGVYVYGYGYNETFAWGTPGFLGTYRSPDTIPPQAVVVGSCTEGRIHIADSGNMNGIAQSQLAYIRLDTDYNMAYLPNPYPNWIDGAGLDTSGYSYYVVDPTKPAILGVSVFDMAGNRTTITSSYATQLAEARPPLLDIGVTTGPRIYGYDTLVNTGTVPFAFTTLKLLYGNVGFRIDSFNTAPLAVGERRLIKISFGPISTHNTVDTLLFGDDCGPLSRVALLGNGGAPDFWVADAVWHNVPYGPPALNDWIEKAAAIHNASRTDILHINRPAWDDTVHFVLIPGQIFPRTIPPQGVDSVQFWYAPTDLNGNTAIASWTSEEVFDQNGSVSIRQNKLIGNAIASEIHFGGSIDTTLNCSHDSLITLAFVISNGGQLSTLLRRVILTNTADLIRIIGHDMHGSTWDPTSQQQVLFPGDFDTIFIYVPTQPNVDRTISTALVALGNGDTLAEPVTATVHLAYHTAMTVAPVTFGPLPYNSIADTQEFVVRNYGSTPITYDTIYIDPTSSSGAAFSISIPVDFPVTLNSNDVLLGTIRFDPSRFNESLQTANIHFVSDKCNDTNVVLTAYLTGAGVNESEAIEDNLSIDINGHILMFHSSDHQSAKLELFDVLGDEVHLSEIEANTPVDVSSLISGVYFYRLDIGGHSKTGKLLIRK